MNDAQQFEVAAFHECGHAFIHHFYRHDLREIAAGGDSGRCVVAAESSNEFWLQHLISCCAGKSAVDHSCGYKSASDDYKDVFACALKLSGNDEQAAALLVEWAERRADVLVEKYWPHVQRLAFALREKEKFTGNGRLSGAEISNVLSARCACGMKS